jgi:adsorption protein B
MPPLELRAINQFLPEMDVIQLPVLPIPVSAKYLTAAHYGDEFAALHARELPIREWFSGAVPSAGVGTGFSARALALAAAANDGQPFSLTSLTEDYDLTMRLGDCDTRHTFVVEALFRPAEDRTGRPIDDAIAVREYFPKKLRAAVRQKGRWIVGNALQGWQQLGWGKTWGRRYFYFRDRKVLVGHLATGLAGFSILCALVAWAGRWLWVGDTMYPRLVEPGGLVEALIRVSLVLAVLFLVVRAAFVGAVYGPAQAVLSIPRAIWGGWINFAASLRALYIFSTQKRPRWDKTTHEFPEDAAIPVSGSPSVKTSPSTRSARG